jgi:hypothetical protein
MLVPRAQARHWRPNIDTLYELTEAECEAVSGGTNGQIVAEFNHGSHSGPGLFLGQDERLLPGLFGSVGNLVSHEVAGVKTITGPISVPVWGFGLHI